MSTLKWHCLCWTAPTQVLNKQSFMNTGERSSRNWYKQPTRCNNNNFIINNFNQLNMFPAIISRNYRRKHVELTEIIGNKIVIVASSWPFILMYQSCAVTQTSSSLNSVWHTKCKNATCTSIPPTVLRWVPWDIPPILHQYERVPTH